MIIKNISENKIREKVKNLGDKLMTSSSHGFEKYGEIRIIDAAERQVNEFSSTDNKNAAVALMGVVLAANRNYNRQVQPHLERMKAEYPMLTFKELKIMLSQKNYEEFGAVWGHKDKKKYDTLKTLVGKILADGNPSSPIEDLEIMRNWAKKSKLENRKQDIIGSVPNIGIATFQHLRIAFGVDTVKPDQRVKEVLSEVFEMTLSSEKAIIEVEKIAHITGCKAILIDQIFVKYGSGYY